MDYKIKHLAKYCCKPANELEFEAVKMAAELGGVNVNEYYDKLEYQYAMINARGCGTPLNELINVNTLDKTKQISVLDFIAKLRMTEEEAAKLEDDRVRLSVNENWEYSRGCKSLVALNGHYFKLNEDGTEVTLHLKK